MSVNETMEEECCAFLSYKEKGNNIQTSKMCMSINEMKDYYENYKLKIGASNVSIQCIDGSKAMGVSYSIRMFSSFALLILSFCIFFL